ncbi:enoyl-CoA hydratase/isomerase family protein [Alsobacter sp. SYSU M60028]|uniref:Enoyl-CoA hydratase/isomerase family protein n=1 Tax=Alsobacter ponti TaxID=2962936 RepID=A0ABT1L9W2_9HYPH|nr:enoyl-CoA hydratase/isomerase family protein [Alsobacter ponti]MCP8938254.1 enoyl-CoA hydratase/isomerase family protein [Alsobacter ponti]
MTDAVRLSMEGAVAVVTLARPAKLNALDADMIAALHAAALRIDANREVRAAILTGEGKGFCAGGDIAAWGELPALEMWRTWTRDGHRAFDALARLRVPLIAALNGHALGGGLELAGTADMRIAETQAKFGLPETGIAMIPGWSGTQRLVRRFGAGVVRRLALTGDIVTAERALQLGIVDEVVETGGAMARAREIAARIAGRGPAATAIAKQLINAAEGEGDASATLEGLAGALASFTDDGAEGVASFREKRPPAYRNT